MLLLFLEYGVGICIRDDGIFFFFAKAPCFEDIIFYLFIQLLGLRKVIIEMESKTMVDAILRTCKYRLANFVTHLAKTSKLYAS